MLLQEAYIYRKPKTILNIENAFRNIKKKYNGLYTKKELKPYLTNKYLRAKLDKELKSLANTIMDNLTKEFNFSPKSKIVIVYTKIPNMGAYMLIENLDRCNMDKFSSIINVSKDGRVRFANNKICNAQILIHTGIIFNPFFTAEMLTASLLHEIGHLFSMPFFKLFYTLEIMDAFCSDVNVSNSEEKYAKLNKFQKTLVDKYGAFATFSFIYFSPTEEREKFADKFSSYYGYSEELSKLLGKLYERSHKARYRADNPIDKALWDLKHIRFDTRPNGYPVAFNRINYLMSVIRNEINDNKDITPRNKKLLNAKIDRINKQLDKMYDTTDDSTLYTYLSNYYFNHKIGKEEDLDNKYFKLFTDYVDYRKNQY